MESARADTLRRVRAARPRRILVVCYGNIYRSAFVARCLEGLLEGGVEMRSGGFHSVCGRPAPERHVAMSRQFGVDLAAHRSSLVEVGDLVWADMVLLMDRGNWVRLIQLGADPEKLIWFGALLPGPVEVADPYEMDDEGLKAQLARLHAGSERLAAEFGIERSDTH